MVCKAATARYDRLSHLTINSASWWKGHFSKLPAEQLLMKVRRFLESIFSQIPAEVSVFLEHPTAMSVGYRVKCKLKSSGLPCYAKGFCLYQVVCTRWSNLSVCSFICIHYFHDWLYLCLTPSALCVWDCLGSHSHSMFCIISFAINDHCFITKWRLLQIIHYSSSMFVVNVSVVQI